MLRSSVGLFAATAASCLFLSACGTDPAPAGVSDTGASATDLGSLDTGVSTDSGVSVDTGSSVEAGALDAGPPDRGVEDTGTPDTGSIDTGVALLDTGAPDVGPPDTGPLDTGPSCAAPTVLCGTRCIDTSTDREHCGACGAQCASGELCSMGRCSPTCQQGTVLCGSTCVMTANDPRHCGACDTACSTGPNGTRVCAAGMCALLCDANFGNCDADPSTGCEVDLRADIAHCGGWARRCVAPNGAPGCSAGMCTVATCAMGFANCDGSATTGCETDVRTSLEHCGACAARCAGRCVAGRCETTPASCAELHRTQPTVASGLYSIDPDGAGPIAAFQAYCDMSTEGGGWTLVATVTNNGDGVNIGSWLQSSPTPNAWESPSATFGTPDPTRNADFRSAAFHALRARAIMVTHRNLFLLRTDDQCLNDITLRDRLFGLRWECGGSEGFASHPPCTHSCVIAAQTVRVGDTAMLGGATRARFYIKAGEADGAQDQNRDRSYLSTSYRDNVDYPTGLGAFCSGSSCTPRTGDADVNDRSDAILPTAGTEFYGVWVR